MANNDTILFPVGRVVAGSLYEARDKDFEGKPLTVKHGPNAGQPRIEYSFGVAYPKVPGQHWANSEWGAQLWAIGHQINPRAGDPALGFVWKVADGDSTVKTRKGEGPANCEREGYPGHWIVYFANGFEPQIYDATGQTKLTTPGLVKRGYYVQVYASVKSNGSTANPGVFMNHNMIAFAAEGEEIFVGMDASAVGFGQGQALPAGARPVTPTPAQAAGLGAAPPPPAAPAVPAAPAPQATYAPPPAAPAPAPAPAAPVAVAPNPGMTAVPAPLAPAGHAAPPPTAPQASAPAAPPPPSAPPAPTSPSNGPQVTQKMVDSGYTYAVLQGAGWTDDQMRAQGYIV